MTLYQTILLALFLFIVLIGLAVKWFKLNKKQYWLNIKTGDVIDENGKIVGKEKNGKIEWHD